MPDPDDKSAIAPPEASGAPLMRGNPDGDRGVYSGQEYDSFEAEEAGRVQSAGPNAGTPLSPQPPSGEGGEDIPAENGRRASIDTRTGEVSGSGVGAGGGQPGEDFSSDAGAGDGYPLTGGEGTDHEPGDLGPHEKSGQGYL